MYEAAVKALVAKIKEYIRKARRQGTVGMSKRNLMQVVDTRGIDLPNASTYQRAFMEAVGQVQVAGFEIYD